MDTHTRQRAQFVTARFRDLQGLRQLVILPLCLLAFWSQPYVKQLRHAGAGEAALGLIASLLPLLAIVAARPTMNRYYARRFGSVAGLPSQWAGDATQVVLLGSAAWIDVRNLGTGAPSAVLIAGFLMAGHIVVRDWPWRIHHLIPAVACGIGASLTATTTALRLEGLADLLRVSFTILMIALMVAAYFDHRLLTRALPPRTAEDDLAELVRVSD